MGIILLTFGLRLARSVIYLFDAEIKNRVFFYVCVACKKKKNVSFFFFVLLHRVRIMGRYTVIVYNIIADVANKFHQKERRTIRHTRPTAT